MHACRQKRFSQSCQKLSHRHTHTHPFNGPLFGTTQVSRYQKCKTNLAFTEARDSEWPWHQLGHMQICTSLQTNNHTSTPPLLFFTGRMPFLPPNQQRQMHSICSKADSLVYCMKPNKIKDCSKEQALTISFFGLSSWAASFGSVFCGEYSRLSSGKSCSSSSLQIAK